MSTKKNNAAKHKKKKIETDVTECQRSVIFFACVCLSLLGFIRITYSGAWLAKMSTISVLLEGEQSLAEQLTTESVLPQPFVQPFAAVVLGILELILSFLVCCSCWCKFRLMIRVVCAILIVFSIVMIVFLFLAMRELKAVEDARGSATTKLQLNLKNLFIKRMDNRPGNQYTFEVEGVQVVNQCCGMIDFMDYVNATLWKASMGHNRTVPLSCCKLDAYEFLLYSQFTFLAGDCSTAPNSTNSNYDQGCADVLMDEVKNMVMTGSVIFISISVLIQLLVVVLLVLDMRLDTDKQDDDTVVSQVLTDVNKPAETS